MVSAAWSLVALLSANVSSQVRSELQRFSPCLAYLDFPVSLGGNMTACKRALSTCPLEHFLVAHFHAGFRSSLSRDKGANNGRLFF